MIAWIGNFTGDTRELDRQYILNEYTGLKPFEDIDIANPRLIMNYDANVAKCNYMEIPEWNRKYFITGVSVTTGNRMIISAHVDVLGTYADDIKTWDAYIGRSSSSVNPYLSDGMTPIKTALQVHNIPFSENPFSADMVHSNYVLTVVGGMK